MPPRTETTPAARGDEAELYRRHHRDLHRAVAHAVIGPRELIEDAYELIAWRGRLRSLDLPAGEDDFIVPGAAPEGHYTLEQQHNFIRDVKLCGRVAADRNPALAFLTRATAHSLRRAHVSLRVLVRADIRRIAGDCGASTAMIHRHYLHELGMRQETPKGISFDRAVEAARQAVRGARVG